MSPAGVPETVQTIDKGHIAEKVLDDLHPTERPKWVEIARFSFRVPRNGSLQTRTNL
jgi:hypothetical protein